jgi:hypothetical protein
MWLQWYNFSYILFIFCWPNMWLNIFLKMRICPINQTGGSNSWLPIFKMICFMFFERTDSYLSWPWPSTCLHERHPPQKISTPPALQYPSVEGIKVLPGPGRVPADSWSWIVLLQYPMFWLLSFSERGGSLYRRDTYNLLFQCSGYMWYVDFTTCWR